MKPLAVMGINIDVDNKAIHRPTAIEKFHAHTKLNPNVVLLRLFPSIRTETVAHFLAPPIQGVVLQVQPILSNLTIFKSFRIFKIVIF